MNVRVRSSYKEVRTYCINTQNAIPNFFFQHLDGLREQVKAITTMVAEILLPGDDQSQLARMEFEIISME